MIDGGRVRTWDAAVYARVSREDRERAESDSIRSQQALIAQYIRNHPDLRLADTYIDDGYTGTNFDRPAYRRMMNDIRSRRINCIIVKDLSRFGRDYVGVGHYLEHEFPACDVRFIAINDNIDSAKGPYDLLTPLKNVLNGQYALDISGKVRSALSAKQQNGEFVGAFASYGYRKDPQNHNHLVIDPDAAEVVRRIYRLYEGNTGKIAIARLLNQEGIPSPSQYKRMMGDKYHNGNRLQSTTYWTYATIHRILTNQLYMGTMVQGRDHRRGMHGKARRLAPEQWIVVPDTHQAIIPPAQWQRVQTLLKARCRQPDFDGELSPFAGFLKCGDCGRAMVKTKKAAGVSYTCGSYRHYGPGACSKHSISHAVLEAIVLEDLNRIIGSVPDISRTAAQAAPPERREPRRESAALQLRLERLRRRQKECYEDYREGLLSKEEYLRYRADYQEQEAALNAQRKQAEQAARQQPRHSPWLESLLGQGRLTQLDRITVAEAVEKICIFADHRIEITYRFTELP